MSARKHHYVPRFLLSGFTEAGTADGDLFVTDLRNGKSWQSTPNGAAHQRDFYRVDVPGVEPDAFEAELSQIEGRAAEVIRETVSSRVPPTGEALADLIRFTAIMSSRTPPIIDHWAKQWEGLYRTALEMRILHPKGFEGIKARARAAGRPIDDMTPEQLLKALDDSRVRLTSTGNVQQLLMLAKAVYPMLIARRWSLLVPVERGAGQYVCSDMPAVVHDPTPRPPFIGPSFAAPESEFSMPLSRNVLLMGRFTGESAAYAVNAKTVAVLNGRTMMYANQLYSPAPDFVWHKKNGEIGDAADLRAAIAERPAADDVEEDEDK